MPFIMYLTSRENLTWEEPELKECIFRYEKDETLNEKVCLLRYDNAKEYKSVETLTRNKIDKVADQYNHMMISGTPKSKGFLDVYF